MDLTLLRIVNGCHSPMADTMMTILTNGLTWMPLYAVLIFIVCRNSDGSRAALLVIGGAALCVLLTAGVSELVAKPLFHRLRPTCDPAVSVSINIVGDMRGSGYSFFSAHAANTFGIALYVSLTAKRRLLTVTMVLWSLLNCYTRLYLGVHYPTDILAGLVFGATAAVIAYRLRVIVSKKMRISTTTRPAEGYHTQDASLAAVVLMLTLITAAVYSAIV